jgi:hypothetical protein
MRSDSPDAVNRWAAAVTAWQGLCRGGEIAAGTGGRLGRQEDLRRLPSRADLSFGVARSGRYAQVMMRPIKRRNGELAEKVPLLFEEGDGGGSDAFAALDASASIAWTRCRARIERGRRCFGLARRR